MSFEETLNQIFYDMGKGHGARAAWLERFKGEVAFSGKFAEVFPEKKADWQALILKAAEHMSSAVTSSSPLNLKRLVAEAEEILAPIGKAAKDYTVHCCGHAHIDMNWMWPWQETVNVCHDTFATVDTLMNEFPQFHFSQSQASTYLAMQEYCPEIFDMIKKRVKKGQWEIIASMWVEGDKNIVSGESLCRHMLYTRQFFKQKMGLEPEAVKVDWSPDTFGHAWTLPSILTRGGVTRYFHSRTGPGPWLYKWRSPDGSEILVFNERDKWGYNGFIDAQDIGDVTAAFVKETGLRDIMYTYGVGDHGGGPTRSDLRKYREIAKWPIFPVVKLSTSDAFFTAVESANPKLPVIERDLNFIFEGCYTTQTAIKYANRVSEIVLPEAETIALIGGAVGKMSYPAEQFTKNWQRALFNHFHDILPGSGMKPTREYSMGQFQEIQAATGAVRTRALRALASKVDTSAAANCKVSTFGSDLGDGLGAGAGDPGIAGGVTARNAGAMGAEPILIYNQKPWPRSETVFAKVWNKEVTDEGVVVRDSSGKVVKGQVTERGDYWGHKFATVAFRAEDVPAVGYKVYAIDNSMLPVPGSGARIDKTFVEGTGDMIPEINDAGIMENDYLRVEVDSASGAVKHLIDKKTGFDYVPEGQLLGVIEAYREAHHEMTAWIIGQIVEMTPLAVGGTMSIIARGPSRVAVRTEHRVPGFPRCNRGRAERRFQASRFPGESGLGRTRYPRDRRAHAQGRISD